ncbi:MAG: class I SAM-dependent methyltransferase [Candidatus Wallbacteria bacterium]|nr:class I SAM-dependent methyltransferase [Candidatus Wallbacteria bacterium]
MICAICGFSRNRLFRVKEMMFGFPEEFDYFECGSCGCVQIAAVPDDLSRYYPDNYYSYNRIAGNEEPGFRSFCRSIRNNLKFFRESLICRSTPVLRSPLFAIFKSQDLQLLFRTGITVDSSILDVGCGTGAYLSRLSAIGFKNLLGIDPYLKSDIRYKSGLRILKKTVHDLQDQFDLVMLHHSLEHIPDQLATLTACQRLLKSGGACLVRIPVADSYCYQRYGKNWVNLDAPRHLFLHTAKSLALISGKAGFRIREINYDSSDFSLWG